MESKNTIPDRKISPDGLKLVRFSKFNELEYARIISVIAHDISNPVAILKSNIQLLRDNFKKGKNELNEEILSLCDESTEELVRFLEDIRLINTSFRSEIRPKFSVFELEDILCDQFLKIECLSLNHKRISITANPEKAKFSSDLNFLQRILLNLLTNALKFSRDEVILNISLKHANLEIEVQDFGVGIPDDEIDQVFNPFFRATNVKKSPGIGLGLTIVKALTESLGGQVYLFSLINEGTIIRIVIPDERTN